MADDDTSLQSRLVDPLPAYDDSTDFAKWIDAHQSEFDKLHQSINQTKDQIHIDTATGLELDLIGREYGILGQRRGRDDPAYRSYLQTLVSSFQGVGTIPGVKLAISAGLLIDEDEVSLLEDFSENKYEIELTDWTAHETGTVRELADLSDPIAIERLDPIHYILPEIEPRYTVGDTEVATMATLSPAVTKYTVGDTQSKTVDSEETFGTGKFDGEGTFS